MRRVMTLDLTPQAGAPMQGFRAPRVEDTDQLAALMLAAYRGTIDDEGETIEDARSVVEGIFTGEHGTLLAECSAVLERDDALAVGCIVTLWKDAPLLAFSMTDPRWKRQGLSRAAIKHCINALLDAGHRNLRLVVTRGNTPAERLYERLGFRDE